MPSIFAFNQHRKLAEDLRTIETLDNSAKSKLEGRIQEVFSERTGLLSRSATVAEMDLVASSVDEKIAKIEDPQALETLSKLRGVASHLFLKTEESDRLINLFLSDIDEFRKEASKMKSSNLLSEIALECAKRDPARVSKNITDFKITDQAGLLKVALEFARKNYYFQSGIHKLGIIDQEGLLQIALVCAEESAWRLIEWLDQFGITDPESLVQIALVCAKESAWRLIEGLDKFGITDPESLVQIALVCAEQSPGSLIGGLDKFGITGQDDLVKIALKCAEKEPHTVIKKIAKFGIADQESLVQIALVCAEKEPWELIEGPGHFGIAGQDDLVKIALKCAEKEAKQVIKKIANFGITDQQGLVEVALVCTKESPWRLIEALDKFGITDQEGLVRIALVFAEKNPWELIEGLDKFGITDQEGLLQIALVYAEQSPGRLIEWLDKFGITDQDSLVKIALKYAEKEPEEVIKKFAKFGITDQEGLLQIALVCAEKDLWSLIENLDNFGITDQEGLVKIALKCAEKEAYAVIKNFAKFGITDQEGLVQISLVYAEKDLWSLIENLDNFGITDQEGLVKIALKCAEKEAYAVINNFAKFGITDQEGLVKIALKCAEKEAYTVINNFANFGIIDQQGMVQIALKCAEKRPETVIEKIASFGITDQQGLVQIALVFAEKNPGTLMMLLDKCEITDQEGLVKIALKCAEKDPERLIEGLDQFGITGQDDLVKIALKCAEENPAAIANNIHSLGIKDKTKLLEIMNKCVEVSDDSTYIEKWLIQCKVIANESLVEETMKALKAASQKSASEKVDIPDLGGVEEVPYDKVREIFASFTDEDLTGIMGLSYQGADREVTPQEHRENFAYFLEIVETDYAITGANRGNVKEKYEPFKRLFKHIAKSFPKLSKEEQIAYLSRFSILKAETFCLDPYIKSARYIYNGIKDEGAPLVSTQNPIEKLQEDLRARLIVVRDTQLDLTVKHTHENPIDTHSRNWVQNVFTEAGYEHTSDDEDMFLYHGESQLAGHMEIPIGDLVQHLTGRFREGLVENCFEGFSKVLKSVLEPDPLSSVVEAKSEEVRVTSETISEYFDQLLSNHQAAEIKAEKEGFENKSAVDTYVSASIEVAENQKEAHSLEMRMKQLDEQVNGILQRAKKRAFNRAIEELESAERAVAQAAIDESAGLDVDDLILQLPGSIKEKVSVFVKEHEKDGIQDSVGAVEEQKSVLEKEINRLKKKKREANQRIGESKEIIGAGKCRALDTILKKSETMKKSWAQDWLSEEDVIDPETGEGMLDANYMPVTRVEISFEGRWEFFKLFMDDEIRAAKG